MLVSDSLKFRNINISLFKVVYKAKKDNKLDIKKQITLLERHERLISKPQYNTYFYFYWHKYGDLCQ